VIASSCLHTKLTALVEGDERNKGVWVRRLHNVTQVLLSCSLHHSPNIKMRLAMIDVCCPSQILLVQFSRNRTATLTLRCLVDCIQSTGRALTLVLSFSMGNYGKTCALVANDAPTTRLHHDVLNSYLNILSHTGCVLIATLHPLHNGT